MQDGTTWALLFILLTLLVLGLVSEHQDRRDGK